VRCEQETERGWEEAFVVLHCQMFLVGPAYPYDQLDGHKFLEILRANLTLVNCLIVMEYHIKSREASGALGVIVLVVH